MYTQLRPVLFWIAPETTHRLTIELLHLLRYIPLSKWIMQRNLSYDDPSLTREVFGLKFKNPVGLAAGFDKNAEVVNELSCMGFGFIEIGSVTPLSQQGNPKPRVFRLPKDRAIVNHMGINNAGAAAVAKNLKRHSRRRRVIVGGNISKNSATPNTAAAADYERAFVKLYDSVDYFVINVSCPNVENLRGLQDSEQLRGIVEAVTEQRKYHDTYKPVLLKLSPDLSATQIEEVLTLVFEYGLDGLVVANTTTRREDLCTPPATLSRMASGGLSGAPLLANTMGMVRYIATLTKHQLPIIASGGVMNEDDALQLLNAGASLVQIYTGLIYNGPGFVKRILKRLGTSYRLVTKKS
ncbi:MAG: quinone-dependent dihydroorotate dehydrogenase [Prevotellaceae bacterium]|jgi:dihydroorotate dehydrogenase|nr:quinone-dependent dihydroorotate dehydrogenase [Prevotellaceae bacterium]